MILQYVTLLATLHVSTKAQFHPMGQLPGMPMGMGMPSMPVQMPIGGPPQMPVVVMPYHSRTVDKFRQQSTKSKKTKRPKKKRRPRQRLQSDSDSNSDSDSDSSSNSGSSSSSDEKKFRTTKDHKSHKRRRQVLTPVISYVTNDGYVVYQKKIKKDRAKDWLEMGKNSNPDGAEDKESGDDEFDARTEKVRKKQRSKSHKSRN